MIKDQETDSLLIRAQGGGIEFPFEAIKVEFVLQAA